MSLATYNMRWDLNEGSCSCDVDFVDYAAECNWSSKSVFHFGTGSHHLVGRRLCGDSALNHVLGITANEEEYLEYIKLIKSSPYLALGYKVLFGDIYTMSSSLMPTFDVISLFHLCEYYSNERNSYCGIDDYGLLLLCISKLALNGELLFYTRSNGYLRTQEMINDLVERRILRHKTEYKSVVCYEPRWGAKK